LPEDSEGRRPLGPSAYRVIQYGVGAIGAEVARVLLDRPDIQVAAAIDSATDKVGQDLGRLAGLGRDLGITVTADAAAGLAVAADAVVHSTGSYLEDVAPQLLAALGASKNVVSTCEELSYPWDRHPALSRQIDAGAREAGVTVLGTGVNPGFVMDTLALALSAACQSLSRLEVRRVVDVSTRRIQLQRKVGVGITPEEFEERKATGHFGHVGLMESARLLAHSLAWPVDDWQEVLEPVVCSNPRRAGERRLETGQVAGIHQVVSGRRSGREVLRLELEMSAGTAQPRDEVVIEGRPPVHMVIEGGIQGDLATAAIVANAIPAVVAARPGLLTMADLPLLYARRVQT
jgi:4-hydroxy-tetrahydrodipicolinate reductase